MHKVNKRVTHIIAQSISNKYWRHERHHKCSSIHGRSCWHTMCLVLMAVQRIVLQLACCRSLSHTEAGSTAETCDTHGLEW